MKEENDKIRKNNNSEIGGAMWIRLGRSRGGVPNRRDYEGLVLLRQRTRARKTDAAPVEVPGNRASDHFAAFKKRLGVKWPPDRASFHVGFVQKTNQVGR